MSKPLFVLLCLAALVGTAPDGADQKPPLDGTGGADLSTLRDITGIERLPPLAPPLLWPYAMTLALALGAAAGIVSWKLVRRHCRSAASLPPEQWAEQELQRIEALGPAARGNVESFHTQLADVIRAYLELRFHLHAPGQTTCEFLAELESKHALPEAVQARLCDMLQQCDLAKFAQAQCSLEDCRALLASARAFVQEAAQAAAGISSQSEVSAQSRCAPPARNGRTKTI